METTQRIKTSSEEEVWNAVMAFEEILQVMPEDRVALETLYEAYNLLGDQAKATDYLLRLGTVVADEADRDGAGELLTALRDAGSSPEILELIGRLEAILPDEVPAPVEEPVPAPMEPARKAGDITAELALAWSLHQAGELKEEEYRSLVHNLSECVSQKMDTPVSVLHVLEDQHHVKIDSVLAYISEDSRTPLISLSHFDLTARLDEALNPLSFRRRGALVFDQIGKEAMVGVVNPYDHDLLKDVEHHVGCTCHVYLLRAADFDTAVGILEAGENAD